MDVFAGAQDILDRGAAAVRGAVSGVAVENLAYMRGFVRMCSDGWAQGWHERNGGNASYRLSDEDVQASRPYFYDTPSSWVHLGLSEPSLGGSFLAVTGTGCHLRNVPLDPKSNVGVVQLNDAGDAWRLVWGLAGGGRPTSELASHVMAHSVRAAATDGASRVLYHAHPADVIALSKVVAPDSRSVTRVLWKAMTECVMVFPQGVGVVDCMAPGGVQIARETAQLMRRFDAVVWAQHGLFASGPDFDAAFGLVHAVSKAAQVHCLALAANGGSPDFPNTISDDCLRDIARSLGLDLNEDFLD